MNDLRTTEEQLRAEIDALKRQLEAQKKPAHHDVPRGPSAWTLITVLALAAALALAGYFLGYLPKMKREQVLAAETREEEHTLPVVNVGRVERSGEKSSLVLPGNIQAITEAPVLARASGYLKKRYVDIGDRVASGQVLAEVEAPELQQQIRQAKASIDQAASVVQQAEAALQQGRANANLARLNAQRYSNLYAKGVVSRQENDTYSAQFEAQTANVQALEKSVAAAHSNAAAAEANLARLNELLGYQTVRAPFAGVITLRNVEAGVLVNEGNTLLFRIAQTDRLRTYLNVPQSEAAAMRVGLPAKLTIAELQGRSFNGVVSRTANALDPSTRTLLTEVQVANPGGTLLPGMYAQVDLIIPRANPPLTIPGDTLVMGSDGPQVAIVRPGGTVHYSRVEIGRDLGDHLEVLSGVEDGDQLAINPADTIREGVKVKPVAAPRKTGKK